MQAPYFSNQAETDLHLLQHFFSENLYANPDFLYDTNPEELIEYCFRQHYVFLYNSFALPEWYKLFQQETCRMLDLLGLDCNQAEYFIRSSRFVQFAQRLLASVPNECDSPSASASGGDLNHVPA